MFIGEIGEIKASKFLLSKPFDCTSLAAFLILFFISIYNAYQ